MTSKWRLDGWLVRRRAPIQMAGDGVVWFVALFGAALIRFDFNVHALHYAGIAVFGAIAVVLQWTAGSLFRLYRGRYRFGSFEEVEGVLLSAVLTTWILLLIDLPRSPRAVPISVPVAGGIFALVLMVGVRYAWRLGLERREWSKADGVERVVVLGAGDGGSQAIAAMQADRFRSYLPVGLLDDDVRKRHVRIKALRVSGTRHDLERVAHETEATTLLVAIPSTDASLLRQVTAVAEGIGLQVKVLPPVAELLDGNIRLGDIRDLDLVDLLGRRQIETDIDSIAGYLTGKRVLVTGAGGSIGSELCRQIARYAPAELIMLDRDESALHAVQLSIDGRALLDDPSTVLADIRDVEHCYEIFRNRRPQVVFHAAALKHLPILERFPGEALKSNVWGTLTMLRISQEYGVERFVNISTDKAANPTSVLGYSKRLAERLTAFVAHEADGTYLSVRFGNVLGSRGSVLTVFAAQAAAGGPLTVTDPEVTRYFMTVQESVHLVIQAAAIGAPGEVLVLDMGEPVRIAEVAQRVAAGAPRPVSIVYTGLRVGEKLHEELFGLGENDQRPKHPLISHVLAPPLEPQLALAIDPWADATVIVKAMGAHCSLTANECGPGSRRD
jgi:FlaA1/EpsC-like NDP-sugar epimerase